MAKWIALLFCVLGIGIGCACSPAPPPPSPIEYRRTGGIAGFNDHLLIDANGHATLTRRAGKLEFDLAPAEWAKLRQAFADAGFASIPADSTRKPYLVPDELSYVLVYAQHTVKTSDTAIPDKLQPVMQMLAGIVDAQSQ